MSGRFVAAAGFGPSTVTLRIPPPLDTPLAVVVDDDPARLMHGDTVVAEAQPLAPGETDLDDVTAVSTSDARAAMSSYAGLTSHPFPECFVCGPRRAAGDGMRLFPGRLGDGRTACLWKVTDDVAASGEFVWAALDCPGGWSAPIEGRPMVLGRMTAEVLATPEPGEECIVMGHLVGSEGRKTYTTTTIYRGGSVLGRARATWITIQTPG